MGEKLMADGGKRSRSEGPFMFQQSEAMIVNKIDLLPYVDFDLAKAKKDARTINRNLMIFEVSCKTSAGLDDWNSWLSDHIESFQRT